MKVKDASGALKVPDFDQKLYADLAAAYAPPGFEYNLGSKVKRLLKKYSNKIWSDQIGNIYALRGNPARPQIALAAHLDEIGFVVTKIGADGILSITAQGLFFREDIADAGVCVLSAMGEVYGKLFLTETVSKDEYKKEVALDTVRILLQNKDEYEKISLGDRVCLRAEHVFTEDYIIGKSADDRAGVYAIIEIFKLLAERQDEQHVLAIINTQEEGANIYAAWAGAEVAANFITPERLFYIDTFSVTTVRDEQTRAAFRLDAGPGILRGAQDLNYQLVDEVIALATENNVTCQILPLAATMTDVMVYCRGGAGIKCAVLAIPIANIHTAEEKISGKVLMQLVAFLTQIILK